MRLALQALFTTSEANEEGTARRALLERRLRASERSAGFLRRLRGVVDDVSLQAPAVFAEESCPDANVVAEYLDAQTPSDLARVYEDACWDSPTMLAEVGRCYDILNNDALNSVVVPKNCRRRLYYIAWEESATETTTEAEEAILTSYAPSEGEEAEKKATCAVAQQENSSAQDDFELVAPKPKKKRAKKTVAKSLKTSKSAKSIGSTLAAERSWGRRVKKAGGRLVFAATLLGVGYFGWRSLEDGERSETLPIAKPEILASANNGDASTTSEETPLCPTTISSSDLDDISPISLNEYALAPQETSDGTECAWADAPKLASLPVAPNETALEGANLEDDAEKTKRTRVGLGGDEPWSCRPGLEIPAQNNDVFTKTRLY